MKTQESLQKRLEGTQSHVNLIPVNTVEGTGYLKSNIKRQQAFINILAAKNIRQPCAEHSEVT